MTPFANGYRLENARAVVHSSVNAARFSAESRAPSRAYSAVVTHWIVQGAIRSIPQRCRWRMIRFAMHRALSRVVLRAEAASSCSPLDRW